MAEKTIMNGLDLPGSVSLDNNGRMGMEELGFLGRK
jgi:hypothetical protein